MIYTVTLNPSLDYIVEVSNFQLGNSNKAQATYKLPGGKGINVSRILSQLDIESTNLGFLGGFVGKQIESELLASNLLCDFVKISEDTRINIKLKASNETEINDPGPKIRVVEWNMLKAKLAQVTENDLVVFSGSIPPSHSVASYLELIQIIVEKKLGL